MSSSKTPIHSSLSGDPVMRDLIMELVSKLPERVRELRRQLEEEDLTGLSLTAHQLKGACGGYGFQPLSEASARVEYLIDSGIAMDRITAQVEELIELLERATAESPDNG
jgi:HPt (histidine-containing phosphotransfer) domain-containing protein